MARGVTSVEGAESAGAGSIAFVVTFTPAVGATSAPAAHPLLPGLEYGPVCVMCGILRVEERENILKRFGAPTKAVLGRAAVATVTAILYTRLAAGVIRQEGCPQRQVGVDHVIGHGAYDVVIAVVKRPKAVIDREGVPA